MRNPTRRKIIDKFQCQICGDWKGKEYDVGVIVEIQAHDIIHKSEGGNSKLDNLITLCDMCHAVVHSQRWREYFGNKGTPENMELIREEFIEFIKSDIEKREKTKILMWDQFGIKARY